MTLALNNPWACGMCRRQADSAAVGRPGHLLWRCDVCGTERAREAFSMQREFNAFEKRALERVRAELMEGDLVVPDAELMQFLEWLVNSFGEEIRREIDSGKAPF